MIATLYLRDAAQNDYAIAEQLTLCEGHAAARGWLVGEVIVDNGVAGMAESPGLSALRDRIASGAAQVVVASDPTRISRDPETLRAFVRLCAQNDADLSFVEPPVSLDSLRALFGDDGPSDADTTQNTDRESGFKPVEVRL